MLKNKRIYSDNEKNLLWEKYFSGDDSVYIELCEAYLPLVEAIAVRHKSMLPNSIEVDDLISDGFFGLADAITKFDNSQNNKFETYATSRIRGAIMDRLRDYDPVSRYYRAKFKKLGGIIDHLSELYQREPTYDELAVELGWDIDEVKKIKLLYAGSFTVNIDEYLTDNTHESFSLADILGDGTIGDAAFGMQEQELSSKLLTALESLTPQESVVIYWKHYENMTFVSIAEILEVRVPRVSRIYAAAMGKLRDQLAI